MTRTTPLRLLALALLALAPGRSDAQLFIGPGSTVPGDILRGEGVFLEGAGSYNYNTAVANSINTDTYIKWNEYIYNSMKNMEKERAERVREYEKRRNKDYQAILTRISDSPDWRDLKKGDALNATLAKLRDPRLFHPSTLRFNSIPLSTAEVRKIPFCSAKDGATVSMHRLLNQKSEWPIGLRKFTAERKAYERAMDAALEEMAVGRLSKDALARIEIAITSLKRKLDADFARDPENKLNGIANLHLTELMRFKEVLKAPDVEAIVKELDTYAGTTVGDLLEFMNRRNLTFGEPKEGDELELYPRLFASLAQQLNASKSSQ